MIHCYNNDIFYRAQYLNANTVEPRFYGTRSYGKLDFMEQIFGPGKNSIKIGLLNLDFMKSFLWKPRFYGTFEKKTPKF